MLLIVGGSRDHNIRRLEDAAQWRGAEYRVIHTDGDPAPAVSWRPGSDALTVNGETFRAKDTALFLRYDVFSEQAQETKAALFDAFAGWAQANRGVGMLNRGNETLEVNKPRALALAKECGFEIPETWITADFNRFADKEAYIAKPVAGGAFTRKLSDMPETSGKPYIVQEKLDYPEMRLFRVGGHYFAFRIESGAIDYRATDDFTLVEVEPPKALVTAMEKLSDRLGLDYAAADLKTDPKTGALRFLEINSMPMFTGYDDAAQGRLSDALFLTLKKLAAGGKKPGPGFKAASP